MKNLKRKVLAGVVAGVAAVGLIASPASAASRTYNIDGPFTSSDFGTTGHYCAESTYMGFTLSSNTGPGLNDYAKATFYLQDFCANGEGPVAQVKAFNGYGEEQPLYEVHLTTGNGNVQYYSHTWNYLDSQSQGQIKMRVCDGYTSSGAVHNCGGWHGPYTP